MKRPTKPTPSPDSRLTYPSIKAASAGARIPYGLMREWKASGLPGFDRNGEVRLAEVLEAVFAKTSADLTPPAGMRSWREVLTKAQAERQQVKLDQERSRLIDRSWMASKLNLAGLGMHAAYHKSIAEHPTRFAAAAGDVAACREVLRGIWDDLFRAHQALAEHFAETNQPNTNEVVETK